MKGLPLILFLSLAGCGAAEIFDPQTGKVVAREITLLKNVQFKRFATTSPSVRTTIDGGQASIDDAAVQAITAGVVEGLTKALVKP